MEINFRVTKKVKYIPA